MSAATPAVSPHPSAMFSLAVREDFGRPEENASQRPAGEATASPAPPRLLDQVRAAIRARHYSRRTEAAYVAWIRRFILFHGKRHPLELGEAEVTGFLTSLATDAKVAASTQSQALSARGGYRVAVTNIGRKGAMRCISWNICFWSASSPSEPTCCPG